MANFSPLNNYILFLVNRVVQNYQLKPPFLDAGSGTGYASKYLAMRGWAGKAIDLSPKALEITKKSLLPFNKVKVMREDIMIQKGKFNTILLFDVIEHIKDDEKVLKKINHLLNPGGYLLLALTSNPKEWRWDDEFYGHYRRYSENDIKDKLRKVGLEPVSFTEYTFPFFWLIRRLYTAILKPPKTNFIDKKSRTSESAISYPWKTSSMLSAVIRMQFLWNIVFFLQYTFFKKFTAFGFGMLVLVQRPKNLFT